MKSSGQQRTSQRDAAHKLIIPQILEELDLNIIHLKRPEKQMLLLSSASYGFQKGNITKGREEKKKKWKKEKKKRKAL